MKTYGYPKSAKLKNKKQLTHLFDKGKWRTYKNLKIVFYQAEDLNKHQIGFSVSKRNFKKALDRNRIKRLLREVYRHQKMTYTQAFGENSVGMLFWNSKEIPSIKVVESQFISLCSLK